MSSVLVSAPQVNETLVSSAAWAALGYVAGKEGNRDALPAGSSMVVDLRIDGFIEGQPIEHSISGRLTVGRDSERASSTTPNLDQVLAWVLGKLNKATREAVLRDLPAEFEANGSAMPNVTVGAVVQVKTLLSKLRQTKQTPVRGSVKYEYVLTPAQLKVVG